MALLHGVSVKCYASWCENSIVGPIVRYFHSSMVMLAILMTTTVDGVP